MDPALLAAAHALDAGDVLGALKRVALRSDAPGLALRGVALARLGKRERARELLQRAAKEFGAAAPLGRARCLLADAEIALAARDLRGVDSALDRASRDLRALGDPINALHADCLAARSLLLRGLLSEAERALRALDTRRAPAALSAEIQLAWLELHLRTPRAAAARAALAAAERAALRACIPAISQEVRMARAVLDAPAARLLQAGREQWLGLAQLEGELQRGRGLLIDVRASTVSAGRVRVHLPGRAVLFGLARVLAEAWPAEATRRELLLRVFQVTRENDSHRARLRVEIARLRRVLRPLAQIVAAGDGFRLEPRGAAEVRVLLPVHESDHARLLSLLADGEAWSSSALASALGVNQRTVQRGLLALQAAGHARATGRARASVGSWRRRTNSRRRCCSRAPCTWSKLTAQMSRTPVEIEREYGPFAEDGRVHGVTFDGHDVWFASGEQLHALDPERGELTRSLSVPCDAGTAFDGKYLYQLAEGRLLKIDPQTGQTESTLTAPHLQGASGMAWAEGSLWVGRFEDRKILELDPQSGKVLSEVVSDRFVTGVTFSEGELWHATQENQHSELRRVDRKTGEVLEQLELPAGVVVSGLEADGQGRFFCGGGKSGKLRVVKRPKVGTRK